MVKFPAMREELLGALEALSDPEYQQRAWICLDQPIGTEDCLDLVVHFFFDDTRLAESPTDTVGSILEGQHEVAPIEALTNALEAVLEAVGVGAGIPDSCYIQHPLWRDVVEAARVARTIIE